MAYIKRKISESVARSLANFKVVALIGPRQVGKSTLAKQMVTETDVWLDLERPADLRKLNDPETFLSQHRHSVVCIDEVQFLPDLFPVLRYLCDQSPRKGQYLILGSASPQLLKQSSETLAGRIEYLELSPLLLSETGGDQLHRLWLQGGYPDSYLAGPLASSDWRRAYIKTFLERDLAMLGFRRSATQMRRFWTMLAHLQGQLLNQAKLAGSLDTTAPTVRSFVEMMVDTFMVRVLPPYHSNVKKRLVKTPKVYLRDSGLLHALLDIESMDELHGHPVFGASFEGFVVEQVLSAIHHRWQAFFYRSATGEELDLILCYKQKVVAVEIKASKSPALTENNHKAIATVRPNHTFVAALVENSYSLSADITVVGIPDLVEALQALQ